ncbi:MAG: tRNA lysidine(34) synthetase TilS [Candidatus Dadabacteria bacterium]|nr:MAG: tRNA lysidine(34) synthetase TilS [Candidatus Dadabacteria bacterium]
MSRPFISVKRAVETEVPSGARLVVGVSGGIDSSVLLHALADHSKKRRFHIEVAHIDHGLRDSSKRDALFVKDACESLGIGFHLKKLDPSSTDENIEAWGRKERYAFYDEVRHKTKGDYILTAHTADDVAETFLMRLLSNKELYSIIPKELSRKWLRPFLLVTRSEISRYAKEHGVRYVEDPTNLDNSFLRNKVRNTLIPFLKENFDPRIVEVVARAAKRLHQDALALDALWDGLLEESLSCEFGSRKWRRLIRDRLNTASPELMWRAIRKIFKNKLGFNLSREKCEEISRLINGDIKGVELSGNLSLRAEKGEIKLYYGGR